MEMKMFVVAHPTETTIWVCSFPETPAENQTKEHDQFIFDLGKERDKLKQQLAESQAREAQLRNAIQSAISWANGREDEWGERATDSFAFLYEALAATEPTSTPTDT
jgi:hypothetical protein